MRCLGKYVCFHIILGWECIFFNIFELKVLQKKYIFVTLTVIYWQVKFIWSLVWIYRVTDRMRDIVAIYRLSDCCNDLQ